MNTKTLIGSAMAVALLGAGVLVGSVVGANSTAAQTPSATATATPSTPSTSPTSPAAPSTGLPFGPGPGRGGHGGKGFGLGPGGQGATAENASRQITNTTSLIDLVNGDLAFANGKMDTADVQRWVDAAEGLLASAQSANSNSQYGQAVAYAHAARELALTAHMQMAQELGADQLPSAGQLPQRRDRDVAAGTAVTQPQASWILSGTYERLVAQGAVIGSASNAQASGYLTDAQDAYRSAYDAYQAGNYTDAVAFAKLAGRLAGVAGSVARAPSAPANSDTPVTVPAPNF